MHPKLYTIVCFLFLSFHIQYIFGHNIPQEIGSSSPKPTITSRPAKALRKVLPRHNVIPLEDSEISKPERVLQVDGSKLPVKPSFPSLPGSDPLKDDFIRGGLMIKGSIPPEKQLTAAPISADRQASISPTQTFKVSVGPLKPDVVRRQQDFAEPIEITPPPSLPTSFPPSNFPTSFTTWTETRWMMGVDHPVEWVFIDAAPRVPAQSSPKYEHGRKGPGGGFNDTSEVVAVESAQSLELDTNSQGEKDQDTELSELDQGNSQDEDDVVRGIEGPEPVPERTRQKRRIEKLARRSKARQG
ncbi:hypothetical protein TWF481_003616 [Arthrobotrys musiformis]|uniref:Uncharacterized protein n=1 Tax=Arthrobotrys musiformis TaxID=47236 RepID=A0AAV9WHK7_9PEZI